MEISCVKLEKAKSLKFEWISAMPENFYSGHDLTLKPHSVHVKKFKCKLNSTNTVFGPN